MTIFLTVKERLVLSAIKTQARLFDKVYFITNIRKNVSSYAKQVGGKISPSHISKAMRKLIDVGLIEKDTSRTLSERKIVYRLKFDMLNKAKIEVVLRHKKKLLIPPKTRTILKLSYLNSLVLDVLLNYLSGSHQMDNKIPNIRKVIGEYFRDNNRTILNDEIDEAIKFFAKSRLLKKLPGKHSAVNEDYEFNLNRWQNEFTMITTSLFGKEETREYPKDKQDNNLLTKAEFELRQIKNKRRKKLLEIEELNKKMEQLAAFLNIYKNALLQLHETEKKIELILNEKVE
jgi:hypothetical protein